MRTYYITNPPVMWNFKYTKNTIYCKNAFQTYACFLICVCSVSLKELLVSQVTQLEEQTIRLKEEAIHNHKEHSSISEELLRTKEQLEVNQSWLSNAHSELEAIKGELVLQKQAVEFIQQEADLRLDARLKEQQSNLEEEFQLSLSNLQKEKEKIKNELRSEIEKVSSEKRNVEVCVFQ